LLRLKEGTALWWCTRWRPPGLGGGLHHSGTCNVYNMEFLSSHCQTLSTYIYANRFLYTYIPMTRQALCSRCFPALASSFLESIKLCLRHIDICLFCIPLTVYPPLKCNRILWKTCVTSGISRILVSNFPTSRRHSLRRHGIPQMTRLYAHLGLHWMMHCSLSNDFPRTVSLRNTL
jgi:hypothetical protein